MRARAGRLLAVHARGECKFRALFPVASSPFDSLTRGVIIIQASPISSWHTPLILFHFLPHALLNLLVHIHPVFSHFLYFHWKIRTSICDNGVIGTRLLKFEIYKDFWTHTFNSYEFNQLFKQKVPEFIWFKKKKNLLGENGMNFRFSVRVWTFLHRTFRFAENRKVVFVLCFMSGFLGRWQEDFSDVFLLQNIV